MKKLYYVLEIKTKDYGWDELTIHKSISAAITAKRERKKLNQTDELRILSKFKSVPPASFLD